MKFGILLLINLLLIRAVFAQDAPTFTVAPERVTTEATDGWILVGDFYLVDPTHPTALLLHELYADRASWNPLIQPLLDAGYNILAVDLRGYGETRGEINWTQAVADVGTWFAWLRKERGILSNGISVIGSSMGSNLALIGCANDLACPTAIAISPGWRYYGLSVERAFTTNFGQRPVMIVYAERDRWPAMGVPLMLDAAMGEVNVVAYPGNAHGMYLFDMYGDTLIPAIVEWLNTHSQ